MNKFGAIIFAYFFCIVINQDLNNKFFQNFKQDKGVILPTQQEYQKIKKDFEYTLVYFQSEHCQICKNFEKVYLQIAQELQQRQPELPVVKMNCTQKNLRDFCSFKEKIKHFPTVRIYHHNQFTKYEGRFQKKEVLDWVTQRTVSSATYLEKEDLDLFRRILELEEIIVLGYFEQVDQQKQKQFSLTSTLFGMAHFYYTNNENVYKNSLSICDNLRNEKHGDHSELVLIHSDHHRCYFYNEIFDHKKILQFLKKKEKAFLRPYDQDSIKMHRFYKLPLVFLFIDNIKNKNFKIFQTVADFYHDQFFFVYIDDNIRQGKYPKFGFKNEEQEHHEKDLYEINHIISILGTKQKNWPEIYVFNQKNQHFQDKWKFNQQFTQDNLIEFLRRVHQNQEPQYKKSESIYEIQQQNQILQIKKLSSLNFWEQTQNNAVIFLEGDKEMCQECEQSYQEFEKAILKFGQIKEFPIKVYRFNVQYNELKDWNFDRVPEIIYVKNKDDIITYSNVMKDKHIYNFILKQLQKEGIIFRSSEI